MNDELIGLLVQLPLVGMFLYVTKLAWSEIRVFLVAKFDGFVNEIRLLKAEVTTLSLLMIEFNKMLSEHHLIASGLTSARGDDQDERNKQTIAVFQSHHAGLDEIARLIKANDGNSSGR